MVQLPEQERELVAAQPGDDVVALQAALDARTDLGEQAVAVEVAEGVVDLLEAVEIHDEYGERLGPAFEAGAELPNDQIPEQDAVGKPGQRVVRRLMLAAGGVTATPVDGEKRKDEERKQADAELRGPDEDGRQTQEDRSGRSAEAQVTAEVFAQVVLLVERDCHADEARVRQPEDDRREEHRGDLRTDERRPTHARDVGQHPEHEGTGRERQRVLADVEGDSPQRLARDDVLHRRGDPLSEHRRAHAAHDNEREGERGGDRDLLVITASRDLQRQQLPYQDADSKERQDGGPARRLVAQPERELGEQQPASENGDGPAEPVTGSTRADIGDRRELTGRLQRPDRRSRPARRAARTCGPLRSSRRAQRRRPRTWRSGCTGTSSCFPLGMAASAPPCLTVHRNVGRRGTR
jgi:hypothetical protein